jgi:S1-C subfamily serine protease
MFLSAVSVLGCVAIASQDGLTSPLSPDLAKACQQRTVILRQGGVRVGQGVFISADGLAIVPGDAAFAQNGFPRVNLRAETTGAGESPATVESYDPVTDVALVRVVLPVGKTTKGVTLASESYGSVALALIPEGSVRAHISRSGVAGVLGSNQRYFPLMEIRLEGKNPSLTGTPVFLPDGRFLGLLAASLSAEPAAKTGLATPGIAGSRLTTDLLPSKTYGPSESTTAFALDVRVMSRIVAGFMSSGRQVRHPWIGVQFKTSSSSGALLTQVALGGPASRAGLQVGDNVVAADGRPILSHVELASHLFGLRIGETMRLSVVNGGIKRTVVVVVGTEASTRTMFRRTSGAF